MVLSEEFLETHKIICCEYQQKLMIAELSFIDYRLLVSQRRTMPTPGNGRVVIGFSRLQAPVERRCSAFQNPWLSVVAL
jgi:hypothetical protein